MTTDETYLIHAEDYRPPKFNGLSTPQRLATLRRVVASAFVAWLG